MVAEARRVKGRRRKGKRPENPVSKMAEFEVEVRKNNCNFSRPFHDAFQAKRVICPEQECFEKRLFFEKNGLGQHYRVIHKKEATDVVMKLACQTMEQFYGEETLAYICFLSERKSAVSI